MAQLLPQGTIRRAVFETVDRSLGWLKTGEYRTLSSICGDEIVDGEPCKFCSWLCHLLDRIELNHCVINARKP